MLVFLLKSSGVMAKPTPTSMTSVEGSPTQVSAQVLQRGQSCNFIICPRSRTLPSDPQKISRHLFSLHVRKGTFVIKWEAISGSSLSP